MTLKKVICDICGKEFEIELRRYNEKMKTTGKFYCSPECIAQSRNKKIKMQCANCGKDVWRSPSQLKKVKNVFCDRHCAAQYNNRNKVRSAETKDKIRRSVVKYQLEHPDNLEKFVRAGIKSTYERFGIDKDPNSVKYNNPTVTKVCIVCGKDYVPRVLPSGAASKSKTCSDECTSKLRSAIGKRNYENSVANGTFKGWQSRNITSYPEKFWIKVLETNNISFEREKYVGKYFLDFVIEKNNTKIDLEIDGKQHKYEDRAASDKERDAYLTSEGYVVYRIDWNCINTDQGKLTMKAKIDEFLNWYNNL